MANKYWSCHGIAKTDQGFPRECPLRDRCTLHQWFLKGIGLGPRREIQSGPYDFDDNECGYFEEDNGKVC